MYNGGGGIRLYSISYVILQRKIWNCKLNDGNRRKISNLLDVTDLKKNNRKFRIIRTTNSYTDDLII